MSRADLRRLAPLLGAALALSVAPAGAEARTDADDAAGPLDLTHAELLQSGPDLLLRAGTTGRWSVTNLAPGSSRSLCLELERAGWGSRRVCLGRSDSRPGYVVVVERGGVGRVLAGVRLARPSPTSVRVRVPLRALGLRAGALGWRLRSSWSGPECGSDGRLCADSIPNSGSELLRLRTPRLVGCVRRGPAYRLRGSRRYRRIALTFDDGPAPYTHAILRILRRHRAHGTFFQLGNQLGGRGPLLRRMLREGHELANHSWNHAAGPAAWQLRATSARLRRLTGFKPCLFRAPYGAISSGLVAAARRFGMSTIQWNLDPRDWATPGAGAIAARVLRGARPGSIVVMHDGGGPRGQTLAALPRIIRGLQARRYQLVTVSELLGFRSVWQPR